MPSEFPAYAAQRVEASQVSPYTPSQVGGETLLVGDLAVWDDANNWIERAAADPTAILGISEVASESARLLTPNGKIPLRLIDSQTIYVLSSATDYVEATHRNQEYGITRSTAGRWQVDVAKTGAGARVVVIDGVPANTTPGLAGQNNLWFVRFLAEFLAADAIDS